MCNDMHMATNIQLDNDLIKEALILGRHSTKRAVIQEALEEYVSKRKQLEIVDLFGTIEYEADYNYKDQRQVK